jgi:hypothetical protein
VDHLKKLLLVSFLALVLVFSFAASSVAADEEDPTVPEEISGEVTDEADEADEEDVDEDFVIPVPTKVVLSNQALEINGEAADALAYNIDGANYFKLRDLAALLTGTGSQFDVGYDEETLSIVVTTGEAYEKIEGDLVKGDDKSATCVPSTQVLIVDGEKVNILVYNIGGNNYFKLRDLGEAVGFDVDYDEDTRTMIITTTDDEAEESDTEATEDEDTRTMIITTTDDEEETK